MARTGVTPEEPDAPPAMTARELSDFCRRVYPKWDAGGVAARLDALRRPAERALRQALARARRAQVMLALALGHAPELLVLDDPTLGLDAVARRGLFDEIVGELADRGTTVFLTTHDLSGFEGIATRVGILKDGPPRARRGAREPEGAVPPDPLRQPADRDPHGLRHRARRLRRRPRAGPRLGHRRRRLELRRGGVRALPRDRRRRRRDRGGPAARGDLPRRRGRGERQDAHESVHRHRPARDPGTASHPLRRGGRRADRRSSCR